MYSVISSPNSQEPPPEEPAHPKKAPRRDPRISEPALVF